MRSFGMYLPLLLALGVFWLRACMGQRLIAGDVDGAMPYFAKICAGRFESAFLALGPLNSAPLISQIPGVTPVFIRSLEARYRFERVVQGFTLTFPVNFIKENGVWKILDF